MYKRCVTEQSAKRQRELEAGLLEAMKTHQYEDITISELCDVMNVPRKSFYRYFSSKEGALFALIDHTLMDFIANFVGGGVHETYDTMAKFFSFWQNHKPLLDSLSRSGLSGILIQRSITIATMDDIVTKSFFPTFSKNLRSHGLVFFVSGLMSLVIGWHNSGFDATPNEMADVASRIITQPMFVPPNDTFKR